jgi:hypothetical protein
MFQSVANLGAIYAPKGLQYSAQRFNPGNRPSRRAMKKGRQIKPASNVEILSNCRGFPGLKPWAES